MFQLRPYQASAVNDTYNAWQTVRDVLLVKPTGSGKCLGIDTPVLMYDGSVKRVQHVTEGDLLMGPDSTPRKVLSLARGREAMYKVTPVKGDPYIVNESHILSLKQTGDKSCTKGKIVNISVKEYLSKSKWFKHIHKGWRAGVDYPEKQYDSFLPPYMLGLWLGDGHSKGASITTADEEIVQELYKYSLSHNQGLRKETMIDNKASVYHFTLRGKCGMRKALRASNLLNNKHIPINYKTGSRSQRLELLAGLLDSDGHYTDGCYDVVFKVKQLADDLAYVARSLGLAAYVKTCTNTGASGTYHRISISGDFTDLPTRLKRNVFTPRKQKKDVLVTGITVTPLGVDDYYGFTIDNDHLFMLGDFTVTHNTVTFSYITQEFAARNKSVLLSVHRKELLGQISLSLARMGVHHTFIASKQAINFATSLHVQHLGKSFYSSTAKICVTSVPTLVRRRTDAWAASVDLQITDEAHHVLRANSWGKCWDRFHNAYGLGVTATPHRADGFGLGRHSDGVFDRMVLGPTMRELIDVGALCDYRVYAPPSDISYDKLIVGSGGEFTDKSVQEALEGSHIVGDAVKHYQNLAYGKRAIVFATTVAKCEEIAAAYRGAGIPAKALSAQNTDQERASAIRDFEVGKTLALVNCDLFSEGFDVPALEVVQDLQPTKSLSRFHQKFGRVLRTIEGKTHGLYLDHVKNIRTVNGGNHALPDSPMLWSLDRTKTRSQEEDNNIEKLTSCRECYQPYKAEYDSCPWCGAVPEQSPAREKQEMAAFDEELVELTPAALSQLRGEIESARMDSNEAMRAQFGPGASGVIPLTWRKRHRERQSELEMLDESIAWWAGLMRSLGANDDVIHNQFHKTFKTNIIQARTLKRADAEKLRGKINEILTINGINV